MGQKYSDTANKYRTEDIPGEGSERQGYLTGSGRVDQSFLGETEGRKF